ncbi:unnamed protein product, partial [Phaeothamnion confervicola]
GAAAATACVACDSGSTTAPAGAAACGAVSEEAATVLGVYLLVVGLGFIVLTLLWAFCNKKVLHVVQVEDKVHMKLGREMRKFIGGQIFWVSIFTFVEVLDLVSDLGAYAQLLYKGYLESWMKVLYTLVVSFATIASLHGVYTRATILFDMDTERKLGLVITGNSNLYAHKQYALLQIMTHKQRCRRHVPYEQGNRYLSSHIMVQRLVELNSMRLIIALFEDVPFLSLNLFLLTSKPALGQSVVFMTSFVLSVFVLGYKVTLLEKHERLQIRKHYLESKMDTDTMLSKKAARGRRYSWACEQCRLEEL